MSKRLVTAVVALALVGCAAVMPGVATAGPSQKISAGPGDRADELAKEYGLPSFEKSKTGLLRSKIVRPDGPNPYLALLEDPSKADFAA